jgi:trans-2-enoyl-CoA reductase
LDSGKNLTLAGDVIIQNGSNSMVGLSVVQLAAARGVKTINIVRDRPEIEHSVTRIKQLGGHLVVTEDYFNSSYFSRLISDLPKPKLGLNCVGGQSATDILRSLE